MANDGYRDSAQPKEILDPRLFPTSEDAKVLRALDFKQTYGSNRIDFIADVELSLYQGSGNPKIRVKVDEDNASEWWVNYNGQIILTDSTLLRAMKRLVEKLKNWDEGEVINWFETRLNPAHLNRLFEKKKTNLDKLLEYLFVEDIRLDIDVGDVLLGGKWKNKRIIVRSIGEDELGQVTINGKPLLNMRIEKEMPEDKKSKETRDQNDET